MSDLGSISFGTMFSNSVSTPFSDSVATSLQNSLPESFCAVLMVASGPTAWPHERVSGCSRLVLGKLGGPMPL